MFRDVDQINNKFANMAYCKKPPYLKIKIVKSLIKTWSNNIKFVTQWASPIVASGLRPSTLSIYPGEI